MEKVTIHKEYEEVNGQTYKIEIFYDLGGFSYFTYKEVKRGYYVCVSPVTLENRGSYTVETSEAFSGVNYMLFEASRRSKASAEKAINMTAGKLKNDLIDYVINLNKKSA